MIKLQAESSSAIQHCLAFADQALEIGSERIDRSVNSRITYQTFDDLRCQGHSFNTEYVAAVVHPWPGALYTLVAGN